MTEFSVIDSSIKHTIEKLSEATVEERFEANQQGINILPLFDSKAYPETRSYTFRNRSLRDILDTICEDYRLQWDAGPDAITVSPRR